MQEAWSDGFLDFKRLGGVNPLDPNWWRKLFLVLEAYDRRKDLELSKVLHSQHMAAVVAADSETSRKHWSLGTQEVQRIDNLLNPHRKTKESPQKIDFQAARSSYESEFGSMQDPKNKAAIDKLASRMGAKARDLASRKSQMTPGSIRTKTKARRKRGVR